MDDTDDEYPLNIFNVPRVSSSYSGLRFDWSERHNYVLQRLWEHKTLPELSIIFGMELSTLTKQAKKLKLPKRKRTPYPTTKKLETKSTLSRKPHGRLIWNDAMRTILLEMTRNGKTYRQISLETGFPRSTMTKQLKIAEENATKQ